MRFQNAYSTQTDIQGIMTDIKNQLNNEIPKVMLVFMSSNHDLEAINQALKATYQETLIFGCTTSGEITSGKMLKNGLVALALGEDVIEKGQIEVLKDIHQNPDVKGAIDRLRSALDTSVEEMDHTQHLGLILMDGMSGSEEKVMDAIGNETDLIFVGGSAGDDLKFKKTWVFANGEVFENAAVLMVLKVKVPFEILKTQSFCPLDKDLMVTKVSDTGRGVLEFNGKPAIEAYSEALGIKEEDLAKHFMTNPVGLVAGEDDIYVRSPQRVEGKELYFYCSIPEGMTVSVLKSTNIIEDTTMAIEKARERLGSLSALINFNCILRTLELEQESKTEAYGKIFENIPTVGFSTYGEAYIGHINQTATMVAFK